MPLTRKEKQGYGTAGVGAGLVYSGAQINERGTKAGLRLGGHGVTGETGRPKMPGFYALKDSRGQKGTGKARALIGSGNVLRAAGTVGVLTGAAEVHRGRKWRRDNPNNKIIHKGLIREGLKGNVEATRERLGNLTEKKPVGALAIPTAIGVGAGIGGAQLSHRALDKSRFKATKSRPGLVALGGLAAVGGSTKISNKVLERTHPEYKVTPAGVQRKKKAPVRPSSLAAHFDQRAGKSAFRRNVVPSDVRKLDTNYTGYGMDRKKKRAAIYAAGSVPLVGDVAAAKTAASLAPPEQRKSAFRTQLAGNLGGSLAGGAAGGLAAGELARRSPSVQNKLVATGAKVDAAKQRALKPITQHLPQRANKPTAQGAAASTWKSKVPGAARLSARYPGKVGVAAGVGALGGQILGGQTAGYKATTRNLNREDERNRKIAKALVVINQGQKVDQKANRATARRKKISGAMSTAGGAVGTAAFGAMVAAKRPSIALKRPKLADQARDIGLVGGGIGGANALYFGRVQRQEAKQLTNQHSKPTTQKVYKNATLQRHARNGGGNVRLSTLEPYRRAPGLRWKNSAHTAEIAMQMKRKGYDKSKPVHVQLWNGKEVFIDDGAHRMWAADMAGRKIVPVKITQHTGRNPRRSSGALNRTFDDVRTARFHTQRRRTMNLNERKLQRLAANKATGWQARQNAKWSARGEARANSRGRLVAMT